MDLEACTMPGCDSGQKAKYVFILDGSGDEYLECHRCLPCLVENLVKNQLTGSEINSLNKI